MINQLIITNDFTATISQLQATYAPAFSLRIFPPLAEQPKAASTAEIAAIEQAALLRNDRPQLFVLAFAELSAIVQNRLLKLLEEPPNGVYFALLSQSTNTILPTVKSRLILHKNSAKTHAEPYDLNIRNMSDADIAAFAPKDELLHICARLLATAQAQRICLDQSTLALFNSAYRLSAAIHTNPALIISTLLLSIRRCCA